jgi:hypothetical protein
MAPDDTVDPTGIVMGQVPFAGYRVEPGATITLRVGQ